MDGLRDSWNRLLLFRPSSGFEVKKCSKVPQGINPNTIVHQTRPDVFDGFPAEFVRFRIGDFITAVCDEDWRLILKIDIRRDLNISITPEYISSQLLACKCNATLLLLRFHKVIMRNVMLWKWIHIAGTAGISHQMPVVFFLLPLPFGGWGTEPEIELRRKGSRSHSSILTRH